MVAGCLLIWNSSDFYCTCWHHRWQIYAAEYLWFPLHCTLPGVFFFQKLNHLKKVKSINYPVSKPFSSWKQFFYLHNDAIVYHIFWPSCWNLDIEMFVFWFRKLRTVKSWCRTMFGASSSTEKLFLFFTDLNNIVYCF